MHSEKIVRLTHEVPQPLEHVWKTFSQVQSQTILIISMSYSGYTSSRTNLNKTVTYSSKHNFINQAVYTTWLEDIIKSIVSDTSSVSVSTGRE